MDRSLVVVVPTWRRPVELAVCVRALAGQTRYPNRVIVVRKQDDQKTADAIEALRAEMPTLHLETVITEPGTNFRDQLNAGLCATTEEIVAFTDDDAEPHRDWIERLLAHYDDPSVGGVGGRDWQPHERWDEPVVGKLSWFGRIVGNHHLGSGQAREVDILKGVNWSFRGDVIRPLGFDERLRGKANVVHTELMVCLRLRSKNWKLIYDPAIAVDHHVAYRHDGDTNARGGFEQESFVDGVHNEVLAMLTHLGGIRRCVYRIWSHAIGTIGTPGVLQTVRRMIKCKESPRQAWARYRAVRKGARMANVTLLAGPAAEQKSH